MAPSDLTTGRRSTGGAGGSLRWLLPALLLVVACGGAPVEPAPKFAGKVIPDPPSQGLPWTPPATKLPRSLVDATAALFELGAADPRGCEYREVEIGDLADRRRPGGSSCPSGPATPGGSPSAGTGWCVRCSTIGGKADLEADVRALALDFKRIRESPQFIEYRSVGVETGSRRNTAMRSRRLTTIASRRRRCPGRRYPSACCSAWAGPTSPSRSTPRRRRGARRRPDPT